MEYLLAMPRRAAPGLLDLPTERLISICRIILAAVSLVAIYLDPTQPARFAGGAYSLLVGYLALAAGLTVFTTFRQLTHVGIIWCHAADIAVATALMLVTEGPTSPFFAFFTFILISATLRWKWRGALGTAAMLIAAFVVLAVVIRFAPALTAERSDLGRTIIRLAYFAVAAAMLAYLGAYLERGRERIMRLARWPAGSGGSSEPTALEAVLAHAASVVSVPRIVAVWEREGEAHRHVTVYQVGSAMTHRHEPRDRFNGLVAVELRDLAFVTRDIGAGSVQVHDGKHRRIRDAIDPDLRESFAIRSVASAPLKAEICKGRVFLLDRAQWTQDHLALAEAIGSRLGIDLDHITLRQRWEREAAGRERLRLARDVHDGVLQGLTAANLQLKLGLKKADPAASDLIGNVREILSGEQRRLREFVEASRGARFGADGAVGVRVAEFAPLVREVGRQWGCETSLTVLPSDASIGGASATELAFFLSEAIANSARHGEARSVGVEVEVTDRTINARVTDNGHGFAGLSGSFTQGELTQRSAGPGGGGSAGWRPVKPVSVIVADDHPIVLKGILGVLAEESAITVLETCGDGGAARNAVLRHDPEIAILDVRMPVMAGTEVLAELRRNRLRTRVIFLTASASDVEVLAAIAGGARAVLLKDMAADDLIRCVHVVVDGGRWFPRAIVNSAVCADASRSIEPEAACRALTAREREVSVLVATGLSNKEVARRLGLSDGTVKLHLHNIYSKAGINNRTALAALTLTYRDLFGFA